MTKPLLDDATKTAVNRSWIETRFQSLINACDLGVEEGWGCALSDIKHVEAFWELIDGDATAHGFVIELHDGRRAYLDYAMYFEDTVIEHGEMVPMGRERYPELRGAIPGWSTEVDDLNKRLAAGVLLN